MLYILYIHDEFAVDADVQLHKVTQYSPCVSVVPFLNINLFFFWVLSLKSGLSFFLSTFCVNRVSSGYAERTVRILVSGRLLDRVQKVPNSTVKLLSEAEVVELGQ